MLCLFLFSPEVHAETQVPEKFTYNVYWAGIRAGNASLELEDSPDGVTITSRAVSAQFISIFYRVEDLAQSILYPNGYPSLYVLKIHEGRHRRDKATYFNIKPDNETQQIIYNNKLDNETVEFNFERPAFDPLSGLYEIRKRQLEVGRSEFIDIFDSKKLWNVEVQVLRKERITTPVGEFNTIVIKPIMQSEGIFMKKGDIYIWLTDDEKKIPAMIKSKVKIGSFVAKLVDGNY
ncbi:MAG: DUF3108 domain-containing protein [Thermodesulfovibrionia bacterium]|nr:DUF3108 domain-containing protein [Thermodesulfovibrionia bacterium]